MPKKIKIMLIVGEASGDSHAAQVVSSIRLAKPFVDFEFFGATGKKMRAAGVENIVNAEDFARVGIIEVATALPMFWRVFQKLKKVALERQPDAVILVDFPDFNLRFAKVLKKNEIKTIYYISPQVWAWKKRRVELIKKYVDLLLTILPFEKKYYAERDFQKVVYVGNPLVGEVTAKLTRKQFCAKHDLDGSKKIISLLPGSRKNEIALILPTLIETASLMNKKDKDLQFVISLASIRKFSEVETAINSVKAKGFPIPEKIITVQNETFEAIKSSDAAAVTSGTATVETAILGTPMAIIYKVSKLNYAVLRHFISIEHIGLINLIAQKRLFRELIQDECNPENLSKELLRILQTEENQKLRDELTEVNESLGVGGASQKAANAIIKELGL